MADFHITPLGGSKFKVKIEEAQSSSTHEVSVPPDSLKRLNWPGTPEELLRRSFQFLLDREPKESILTSFKIDDISKHFPDFDAFAKKGFK